uniref:Glucagon / GIP / secretin / VIP family domain-containing protein n=1 Tax=Esox lucius TaxID=8010 RepID=A0A3P8Y3T5_ESOLU
TVRYILRGLSTCNVLTNGCDVITRFRGDFYSKIINNFKRHSEGTFTNDYTNYLDKIKAKDFVQWLVGTKRERYGADTSVVRHHL